MLSGYDEPILTVRLEQIDELQGAFNALHTKLEEMDFDEIGSEMSESFDEFIVEFKSSVRAEKAKRNVNFAPHSTLAEGVVPHQCSGPQTQPRPRPMPLPPVQLPTFGEGYANWADFYSVFTSIIDSHPDLSNIEKFQHLRSCLRDSALETIRSLEISNSNYEAALELFQKRFDNRRLVFQAHITEILGLMVLRNGSVALLRELSDKFNAHIRALKGFGTTEQIAGCIIVQVLLQKLDAASQAKWKERLEDPVFANLWAIGSPVGSI